MDRMMGRMMELYLSFPLLSGPTPTRQAPQLRPGSTATLSKQVELRRPPAVGKRLSQIAAAVDAIHRAALLSGKSIPPCPKNSPSGLVLSGAKGGSFVEALQQTPGNPPAIACHGMITDVALETLSGHSGHSARRTSAAFDLRRSLHCMPTEQEHTWLFESATWPPDVLELALAEFRQAYCSQTRNWGLARPHPWSYTPSRTMRRRLLEGTPAASRLLVPATSPGQGPSADRAPEG